MKTNLFSRVGGVGNTPRDDAWVLHTRAGVVFGLLDAHAERQVRSSAIIHVEDAVAVYSLFVTVYQVMA